METIVTEIISYLPDSWGVWVAAIVAICAAVCTVLPSPGDTSSKLYTVVYKMLQFVALNIGKAKNAGTTSTITNGDGK